MEIIIHLQALQMHGCETLAIIVMQKHKTRYKFTRKISVYRGINREKQVRMDEIKKLHISLGHKAVMDLFSP